MRTGLAVVVVALAFAGVARAQTADGGAGPSASESTAALPPEPAVPPAPMRSAQAAALPAEPGALPAEPSGALPAVSSPLGLTSLGGYGEILYLRPSQGTPIADLRRFVLFVGHSFNEHFRFYSEVEVEHAVSSKEDEGEVEIEQAYLDYLHRDWLNARAGLILMPVGIINQFHEPPTFNGVERPLVDTAVVPSTWRELGLGIWGNLGEDFRYQLYLVSGMRATGFTAEGIAEGHQEGQLARMRSGAVVGRLDYAPLNGLDVGASLYTGSANQGELPSGVGHLTLGELDARWAYRGLELRAEGALSTISKVDQIPTEEDGAPGVGSTQYGFYGEAGYDLMRLIHPGSAQRLVVYGRYQRVDTQADVPEIRPRDGAALVQIFEGGLTYRPISEIALKGDVRRFDHPNAGYDNLTWIDLGLGWMF